MLDKQQAVPLLFQKFAREKDATALVPLLNHQLSRSASRDIVLENLADYFAGFLKEVREQPWGEQWSLARLILPFQMTAAERGISVEEFYPAMLERLVDSEPATDSSKTGHGPSTREKILNASLEVFSEKGFHLATVDEIAERAGVGKGTLYRYFKNKEALFNEVVNVRLQELENKAEAVLDGQDDVLTLISKYMQIYFEFFDQNQRFYRVMVQEQLDLRHRVQDFYIEKLMRRVPLLKRKISEAKLRNIVKDVSFQTVFYGVMGFMHGVIQKWLAHDCAYSLMAELPTVRQVLFHGFVRDGLSTGEVEPGGQ